MDRFLDQLTEVLRVGSIETKARVLHQVSVSLACSEVYDQYVWVKYSKDWIEYTHDNRN